MKDFLEMCFTKETPLGLMPREFVASGFLSAHTGVLATSKELDREEEILKEAKTTYEYLGNLDKRNLSKLNDKHMQDFRKYIVYLLVNSYNETTLDRKIALIPALSLGVQLYQEIYYPNRLTLNQSWELQDNCELYEKTKGIFENMQKKVLEKYYDKEEILKIDINSLAKNVSTAKRQGISGAKTNTPPSSGKLSSKILPETRLERLAAESFVKKPWILDDIEYLENTAPEIVALFNQGELGFSTAMSVAKSFDTPEKRLEALNISKKSKQSINKVINSMKKKSAALGNTHEEFEELPEAAQIFQIPGIFVVEPIRLWENEELARKKLKLVSRILGTRRVTWYIHDTDEKTPENFVKLLKKSKIKISQFSPQGIKID